MLRRIAPFVAVLVPCLASAQEAEPPDEDETPSLTWVLERAEVLDGQADYGAAAELYEVYAEACLDTATAALERGAPCTRTDEALMRAFELRRALGQAAQADADAARFRQHFFYAQPRRALQIGYQVARMHLEAGRSDAALAELDELDAAYPAPPARQAIVSDGLRAVIATREGDRALAARLWRRVEHRWDEDRLDVEVDGPVPMAWVQATVAEGRLVRAQPLVERYFATRPPVLRGVRSDSVWWSRVSSWLQRSRRRLVLARLALERVYELGSVEHSVIAAAHIGEMYGRQADVHDSLSLPEAEVLVALAREGQQRPGYQEARAHFETCVAWAANHGVASAWADRCARGLNALDPETFPLSAELHAPAAHLPLSPALPPGLED
ncbi:MAG: hypothetical protein KC619_08600 [Myxococcales bacterium]|nr:hypothetical protein [Myxococcales bacterium]